MSQEILLGQILQELQASNTAPLAIHVNGTVTYVIYGATTYLEATGYPILRVTEPSASQTYMDKGFLLESDRKDGANGSVADVNLKSDATNALLLLTNPSLTYG